MLSWFRVNYLSPAALVELKNYKYVSSDYSIMDHVFTPFWNKVTELFPRWLAPNLITLAGLVGIFISVLQFLSQDVSMTKKFSGEYYLFAGAAIFVYQTLDACDGKQARRTGSSSPLGQLFDHGCDALVTVFSIFITIQTLRVGPGLFFLTYSMCQLGAFFVANWEEHYTGVLQTNFNGFGVTELLLLQYSIVASASYFDLPAFTIRDFGMTILPNTYENHIQDQAKSILMTFGFQSQALNKLEVNIANFANRSFWIVFVQCLATMTNFATTMTILKVVQSSKRPLLYIIESLMPIVLVLIYLVSSFAFFDIVWKAPFIVIFIVGTYFALQSTKLIITNVTRQNFSVLQDFHLSLPFLVSLILLPIYSHLMKEKPAEQREMGEIMILSLSLMTNVFTYLLYVMNVIRQITSYLDIDCFSIKKQTEGRKVKAS